MRWGRNIKSSDKTNARYASTRAAIIYKLLKINMLLIIRSIIVVPFCMICCFLAVFKNKLHNIVLKKKTQSTRWTLFLNIKLRSSFDLLCDNVLKRYFNWNFLNYHYNSCQWFVFATSLQIYLSRLCILICKEKKNKKVLWTFINNKLIVKWSVRVWLIKLQIQAINIIIKVIS